MPDIFPSLPGLAFSVFKEPQFKTRVQKGVSGRELRLSFQPVPTWLFKLKFNFLRDKSDQRQPNWGTTFNELRTLMGFFLQEQGSLTPFYFDDPTDDEVVGQAIGTGDGTTTQYQLVRTMGNFNEPIVAINAIQNVYLNGVATAAYSYLGNGIINFSAAPGNGVGITADFTYYFLVRFADDTYSFEYFLYQLWQLQELKLQSVLL